ncbi:MAG: polysaccharide deacetylase family protein [Thermodesulfobacteriota bacterium]|nr:polysaccharide deacetylase family protein [Thermodesulfobacteriota bacterium]
MKFNSSLYDYQIQPKMPPGKDFVVWLTHDVDRVAKTLVHGVYYSVSDKKPYFHIKSFFSRENPYWNFDRIMELEEKYNARSTFFFLNESIKPKMTDKKSWILSFGRYRIKDKIIQETIKKLDSNGWEIGLHGSYNSFDNKALLLSEKNELEKIVKHPIFTSRQHYWNNKIPATWQIQADLGIHYDATFIEKDDVGFKHDVIFPFRPFNDGFIVFPTVIMERYLLAKASNSIHKAKIIIDKIIEFCRLHRTVMTVLWHQRFLNRNEFSEYYILYEYLLDACQYNNGYFCTPGQMKFEDE